MKIEDLVEGKREDTEETNESLAMIGGGIAAAFLAGNVSGVILNRKVSRLVQRIRRRMMDLFGAKGRKFVQLMEEIEDIVDDLDSLDPQAEDYEQKLQQHSKRYDQAADKLAQFINKPNNQAFISALDRKDIDELKELFNYASRSIEKRKVAISLDKAQKDIMSNFGD